MASAPDFRQTVGDLLTYVYPNFISSTPAGEKIATANAEIAQGLNRAIAGNVGGKYAKTVVPDIDKLFKHVGTSPELLAMQENCQASDIDTAAAGTNPRAKYRCGWLYKRDPASIVPKISEGWLGTEEGPLDIFDKKPEGRWFWDLEEAKKAVLIDRCSNIRNCADLASPILSQSCGYCKVSKRGIAIGPTGQPLYPADVGQNCAPDQIVRAAQFCPPPAPPRIDPVTRQVVPSPTSVCTRLPNGRLAQDCLIQQVRMAGCADTGSLSMALKANNNPQDYLATLKTNNAYKVYQDRSPTKLSEMMLSQGTIGAEVALQDFTALANLSRSAAQRDTALGKAAFDLCTTAGTIDTFDFCTEIADSSPPPFGLDCLQKEFKKAGGIPAGTLYPSQKTIQMYNAMPTWLSVKEFIRTLSQQTRSTDISVQEKALMEFLGIRRETLLEPTVPKINAYEIFNFRAHTNDNAIFMGRVFSNGEDGFPVISNLSQLPAAAGPKNSAFVIVSDLRPGKPTPVQFSFPVAISNGVSMTINGDRERMNERMADKPTDYRRDFPHGKEMATSAACTSLAAAGRNFMKIYYNNPLGTAAEFQVQVRDCAGPQAQAKKLPGSWIALSQEIKAPVLSFEVRSRDYRAQGPRLGLHEYRMPEFFIVDNSSVFVEDRPSNLGGVPNRMRYVTLESTESKLEVNKLMHVDSWTAFTLCFRLNRPNKVAEESVMAYRLGNLRVINKADGTTVVEIKGQPFITARLKIGEWYVLYLEKTNTAGWWSNFIAGGIFSADFVAGNSSAPNFAGSRTFSENHPICPNGVGIFSFGKDAAGPVSAGVSIAWLRFYDHVLKGDELRKDLNNKWIRDWEPK